LINKATIFISHTIRDPRDFELAHRLAATLQDRGAKVWIAPESIPAGSNWKAELVRGLLEQSSHFLVVLTAASVASDWVLKEVEIARQRKTSDSGFQILPLPIGHIGAYAGKDYIEDLQHVPYYEDFHAQLDAIARAVGLAPPIPQEIQSIIAEKTEGFVGRNYIFDAIQQFLNANRSGYVLVQGDPGAGKSAIAAEFVKRTGCVAHFNNRALGINRPEDFLENVPAQIVGRFGLPYPSVPANSRQDGAFLKRVLDEAAAKLNDQERLVILVDALDEVDATARRSGTNTLCLPPHLPRGIYFVLTARRETTVLVASAGTPRPTIDLSTFRRESESDIRTYLDAAVQRPALAARIAARGVDAEVFINELVRKSDCNFMYLRNVLPAIEHGFYQDLTPTHLPQGLEGYYEDHWERMGMRAKPFPRTKLNIIYVLAEVTRAVSRRQIERFCGEDPVTVQEVLDDWRQFIHSADREGEIFYSIYHASFADFLHRKDIVKSAGDAGVTVEGVNAMIGNTILDDIYSDDTSL